MILSAFGVQVCLESFNEGSAGGGPVSQYEALQRGE